MGDALPPLEPHRFRDYLLSRTRARLARGASWKLEASDIVQATLLEAHRKRDQFRGRSEAEMAGWLRQLLAYTLVDAARALRRARRDTARERPLEAEPSESSARPGDLLASSRSTPSKAVERHEDAVRLARALGQLPESQHQAIVLRHCHGHSLEEVGQRLERTPAAVAGLLKRGLRRLRELLAEEECHDGRSG
jgi:RNA polymerase sigma-70 factor (ECF subfamily)